MAPNIAGKAMAFSGRLSCQHRANSTYSSPVEKRNPKETQITQAVRIDIDDKNNLTLDHIVIL